MRRKRIYIAGPITKGVLAANVNQATAAFVELAKMGLAPFCPHWSVYAKTCGMRFDEVTAQYIPFECTGHGTVSGNDVMKHEDWLGIDLAWVAVSDAVFRLPGESTGADMEVAQAKASGLPVFTDLWAAAEWAAKE